MEESIRIAGVVRESIVDGPGLRFVVFCQGCPHNCKGCHNPITHDFAGGYDCSINKILKAIDENPLLDGVTFSGGEPVCQSAGFLALGKELVKRGLNILMFTGYTFEQLQMMKTEDANLGKLLEITDILIDGPYVEAERDLTLSFRGSRNQRILDMKLSLESGSAVNYEKK